MELKKEKGIIILDFNKLVVELKGTFPRFNGTSNLAPTIRILCFRQVSLPLTQNVNISLFFPAKNIYPSRSGEGAGRGGGGSNTHIQKTDFQACFLGERETFVISKIRSNNLLE